MGMLWPEDMEEGTLRRWWACCGPGGQAEDAAGRPWLESAKLELEGHACRGLDRLVPPPAPRLQSA